MEELIKAYQRFMKAQEHEPEELVRGIDYLEFVKENLCSPEAVKEHLNLLKVQKEKGKADTLFMYCEHMTYMLEFLHNYTTVTKRVCEKTCDSLAHTTEERKNLYQELFNDIKIWKF